MADSSNAFQTNAFQKSALAFQGPYGRSVSRTGAMTVTHGKAVIRPRALSRTGTFSSTISKAVVRPRGFSRVGAMTTATVHHTTFVRTLLWKGVKTAFQASAFQANAFQIMWQDRLTKSVNHAVSTSRTGHMTAVMSRAGSVFRRTISRIGSMTEQFRFQFRSRWSGAGSAYMNENPNGLDASPDPIPNGIGVTGDDKPSGAYASQDQP